MNSSPLKFSLIGLALATTSIMTPSIDSAFATTYQANAEYSIQHPQHTQNNIIIPDDVSNFNISDSYYLSYANLSSVEGYYNNNSWFIEVTFFNSRPIIQINNYKKSFELRLLDGKYDVLPNGVIFIYWKYNDYRYQLLWDDKKPNIVNFGIMNPNGGFNVKTDLIREDRH